MNPVELILILTIPIMILMYVGYRNLFTRKSDDKVAYLQNKRSFKLSLLKDDVHTIHEHAKLLSKSQHISLKDAEEMLIQTTELAQTKEGLDPTIKVINEMIHHLKYGLGYPKL